MRKSIILALVKPRTRWSLNLSFHGNLTIYLLSLLPPPMLPTVVILLKFQENTLYPCIMIPHLLQTKIHAGHRQSLRLTPCLSPNLRIIRTYQMNRTILRVPSPVHTLCDLSHPRPYLSYLVLAASNQHKFQEWVKPSFLRKNPLYYPRMLR